MPKTYLVHHGIKGQKWGVRRFQNDDGSLTAAGQERYGGKKEYANSDGRDYLTGRVHGLTRNEVISRHFKDKRERYEVKRANAQRSGNDKKVNKLESKIQRTERIEKAYSALNADRLAYDRHTSTGKMLAQNLLMTGLGGELYRDSRAMGYSRGKAFTNAMFGRTEKTLEKHYGLRNS